MSKKNWISAALGGLLVWVGMHLADAAQDIQRIFGMPSMASHRPLTPVGVDPSWVQAGKPAFRLTEMTRSADGDTIVGQWDCTGPTTFEWRYGLDEDVHLLEGRVEVDYDGRHIVLVPGSVFSFRAGTRAVWHIDRYARKVYTLHRPGLLVRAWRKLAEVRV